MDFPWAIGTVSSETLFRNLDRTRWSGSRPSFTSSAFPRQEAIRTVRLPGKPDDRGTPEPRTAGRLDRDADRIGVMRSEEHTSELQSLMRISYAVFCLKKQQPKSNNHK